MGEPSSTVALSELIAPLTTAEFRARHWVGGAPFVSRPNPALIEKVRAIEGLASVEALLPRLSGTVRLLGPNAIRADVAPSAALDFLNRGSNLYIAPVERSVPGVIKPFTDVANELGVPPWQLSVEAFAGRAGGLSSRHYDHDINFQILLDGEKRWRLEPNHHITNPLRSFHPQRRADGSLGGFTEAAYAANPVMPAAFDRSRMTEVTATAGCVVFLPRGYWHEVDSLSTTWGVNLVVKGQTWTSAIAAALSTRLTETAAFREYCEAVAYGHYHLSPEDSARADAHFERLQASAIAALRDMTRTEVALATQRSGYRWQDSTEGRAVVNRDGAAFLSMPGLESDLEIETPLVAALERLVAFREPFTWADAMTVARELTPIGLSNLLNDLVTMGVLTRQEPAV